MKPFTIIAAMVCGIYLLLEWTEGGKVCYYTTTIDETGATKWTRDKGDCDVIKFGGVKTTATPFTGKTVQESKEPTTAVTAEPQGTTLGKTMQESEEPTTAVTTEPHGTTLGKTVQESKEPTVAVTNEPQGTTLGKTVQESKEPTTAVTTEPQGPTLGKTVQESKEPTTEVTTEPQGTTLGQTIQETKEPTTAVTTEPQGTTQGKTMQETKEPTTAVTTEPQGTTLGKTVQKSKEPTTAVTTEPQGTTLGKTVQETKEPTTTVTTEPQGTILGKTVQESEEPTTTVTTEGTTLVSTIYTCPPNMVYGNCTCEATCEDPKGESACNSTCLGNTGCICKAGLMLNGSDCISASRCSCFVTEANLVISNGKTYVDDNCTQKCSCSNNRLTCEDYSCSTNAVCDVENGVRLCYCNDGYAGDGEDCRSLSPRDCQDVYDAGHTQDGVYTIMPTGWPGSPFNVSCKMENGGGWTVFQRRTDGSTSFYQNWTAYKDGFGDSRNLWLGNEKLHYLTNQRNYTLRFDITTSSGSAIYAEYTEFQIESESSNYTMNKLGTRSGITGSFLFNNRGKQFSTYDRDNDGCGHFNCAEKHRSGWWYLNHSYYSVRCSRSSSRCNRFQYNGNCHSVCTTENLNGDYNGGNGENIFTNSYYYCNVRSVEMKIRPSS